MRVRIGAIEVLDPTWDELEQLVERYGSQVVGAQPETNRNKVQPHNQGNGEAQPSHSDRVVLEQLVKAGAAGVPSQELGEVLGRRGKAIGRGLREWAQRIGLVSDAGIDAIEECRVGTRRGARIRTSLLPVAKKLMGE